MQIKGIIGEYLPNISYGLNNAKSADVVDAWISSCLHMISMIMTCKPIPCMHDQAAAKWKACQRQHHQCGTKGEHEQWLFGLSREACHCSGQVVLVLFHAYEPFRPQH